jgi:2-polyprenyl-6-methoxyphenol hydroxylase-like FAD-dependent oxidoreductase
MPTTLSTRAALSDHPCERFEALACASSSALGRGDARNIGGVGEGSYVRRAVVIGGSLAGMCAARALAGHFDEVLIIDRDVFPRAVDARAGVPQARHAHVMLERGARELEALFPGFLAEALRNGAQLFDPGLFIATRRSSGWQPIGPLGTELLWASRDLIEYALRARLEARADVRVQERTQLLALHASRGPRPRIEGITVRERGGAQSLIRAELVVDASGRATRAENLLRELGVAPPDAERVDSHAGYASRLYRAPSEQPKDRWWKGLWIEGDPPHFSRAGVLFPVEGGRWLVTIGGVGADVPPTDEVGFEAFLHSLRSPALVNALAHATPISEVSGSRQFANVYRRYDRWRTPVAGLLATGDAFCAFNPLYGQGMSVAASCAGLLRAALERGDGARADFTTRFFREQAAFVAQPWRLATGADFIWPGTDGKRPRALPLVGSYLQLAMRCAQVDLALRRHINPVFNLTGSMSLFFSPPFVAKVLLSAGKLALQERLYGKQSASRMPPVLVPA